MPGLATRGCSEWDWATVAKMARSTRVAMIVFIVNEWYECCLVKVV